MTSYDFYDTLFTRLVADPRSIFLLIEERLGWSGFAEARVSAELQARKNLPSGEVALQDIYRAMPADPRLSSAKDLELKYERELLVPIRANADRLTGDDIVVSDMYLPGTLLADAIKRELPHSPEPEVIVSGEVKARKADGTMWTRLKRTHAELEAHVGDSFKGDVLRPRMAGLRASFYTGSRLNRYERKLLSLGTLDGSAIAGLARATRVSATAADGAAVAREEVFASVVAPLLFAFVEHVLADSLEQGIRKVLFLARDGQVLCRLAEKMIAARSLEIEATYAYGSRHALHLPGFDGIDRAESWLLEDTPHLSLAEVASRAEMAVDDIRRIGRPFGFPDADQNLDQENRSKLSLLIREPAFLSHMSGVARAKRQTAVQYYRGVGLSAGQSVALVDVGWTGRMQASLRSLLGQDADSPRSIRGHYLCLSSKLRTYPADDLQGYLHDPEVGDAHCPFDPYRCVVEACLMADHGTTLGFAASGETVRPVLGKSPEAQERQGIVTQQQTILRFADLALRLERVGGRRIAWPKDLLAANLLLMLRTPSATDALAFTNRGFFEGQADNLKREIVRKVPLGPGWLRRSALGLWPEASIRVSGGGQLLGVVRAARWALRHSSR